MTINETCVSLSIDPSAFARSLRAAMDLHQAKLALSEAISADFEALREEGLTEEEEQALKLALYTINSSVAAVKRLRPMGWADFKHKLVARGVMAKPDANVPQDWVDAFLKAHGRVRRRA